MPEEKRKIHLVWAGIEPRSSCFSMTALTTRPCLPWRLKLIFCSDFTVMLPSTGTWTTGPLPIEIQCTVQHSEKKVLVFFRRRVLATGFWLLLLLNWGRFLAGSSFNFCRLALHCMFAWLAKFWLPFEFPFSCFFSLFPVDRLEAFNPQSRPNPTFLTADVKSDHSEKLTRSKNTASVQSEPEFVEFLTSRKIINPDLT